MRKLSVLSLVALAVLFFLTLTACDEDSGSSNTGQVGGENQACYPNGTCNTGLVCASNLCIKPSADGDGGGLPFGETCTQHSDCQSGLCFAKPSDNFCSASCTKNSDCEVSNCCAKIGSSQYCMKADYCGSTDGDTDGTDAESFCTNDSYRCRPGSTTELERCTGGDWSPYRDCAEDSKICDNGQCKLEGGCEVGTRKCEDQKVMLCNTSGAWVLYNTCTLPNECREGECVFPWGDECTSKDDCGEEEYCLPEEAGKTDGHCVPYCDTEGVYCPKGWECLRGLCSPIDGYCTADRDCGLDEFCYTLPGKDDGKCQRYCFELGEGCRENYRCSNDPQKDPANYGRCVPINPECVECSYDAECLSGQYCQIITGQTLGCCQKQCTSDDDCPSGLSCRTDGRCGVGPDSVECAAPCPPPYVCDKTFGECVLPCPACPENYYCDETTAPKCKEGKCINPTVCGLLLPPCCFGYNCSAVVYGIVGYCQ